MLSRCQPVGARPALRAARLPQQQRATAPQRASTVVVQAGSLPSQYKSVTPFGDRVLVKMAEEESTTSGGIVLPSSAVSKPTTGVVTAVGDGYNAKTGKRVPIAIAVGDRVVYSKYAGTEVSTSDCEQILLKAEDVIGTLAGDDIRQLKPFSDRVLIAKSALTGATSSGVLLPSSAGDSTPTGRVVACGPGRLDDDGVREAIDLPAGAAVLYTQYAGVEFEPTKEDREAAGYVVVRKDDIMVRLE